VSYGIEVEGEGRRKKKGGIGIRGEEKRGEGLLSGPSQSLASQFINFLWIPNIFPTWAFLEGGEY
jgi:hypothetical protein